MVLFTIYISVQFFVKFLKIYLLFMKTAKPRLGIYFMLHDASKDTCFYNISPERAWLTYLSELYVLFLIKISSFKSFIFV